MSDGPLHEQFRLCAYLNEIQDQLEFRLDTLDQRIRLQKTVYLMQTMGLDLNYDYRLYLHGPYSTELTRDAFALKEYSQEIRSYMLSNSRIGTEDGEKIRRLKDLMENLRCTVDYEVITTLLFLKNEAYISDRSKSAIFKAVIKRKPHANLAICGRCWKILEDFELVQADP